MRRKEEGTSDANALNTQDEPPTTFGSRAATSFCYNIGRIASAVAVVFSGQITAGGNFQRTLLLIGLVRCSILEEMTSPSMKF